MDNLLGLLRITVKRGIKLAVRDIKTSDPYVVVKMGDQRLKTGYVERDLNPVWNEDLTLPIDNPEGRVSVKVFDRDIFSRDDEMGDAEFEIQPFLEAQKTDTSSLPDGTIIKRIPPGRSDCLSEESCISFKNGKIIQNMTLRLQNVESGEVELELQWIDVPGVG